MTPEIAELQLNRWDHASLVDRNIAAADRIVDRILRNKERYVDVDERTRVPWYVIAALHNMESGGDFSMHLHEGSPLTGRTKFVPKGRPLVGNPPFTWEESAVDALTFDGLPSVDWRDLAETLYACECYNGKGYLNYHKYVPSPYLWSGTSIEIAGKYVEDGRWDPDARSKQLGVCAILKRMESRGILNFALLRH